MAGVERNPNLFANDIYLRAFEILSRRDYSKKSNNWLRGARFLLMAELVRTRKALFDLGVNENTPLEEVPFIDSVLKLEPISENDIKSLGPDTEEGEGRYIPAIFLRRPKNKKLYSKLEEVLEPVVILHSDKIAQSRTTLLIGTRTPSLSLAENEREQRGHEKGSPFHLAVVFFLKDGASEESKTYKNQCLRLVRELQQKGQPNIVVVSENEGPEHALATLQRLAAQIFPSLPTLQK